METTLAKGSPRSRNNRIEVEVSDVIGQQRVVFPDIAPATPVGDLVGLSKSRIALPPVVDFQMRDNGSSRLLRNEQSVGEIARDGQVKLTLQPDVRLG